MKKFAPQMLFACVLAALFLLSTSAHAHKACPTAIERTALNFDAIIAGKIVSVSKQKDGILTNRFTGKKVKISYKIAVVKVDLKDGILRNDGDVLGTSKAKKGQQSILVSVGYTVAEDGSPVTHAQLKPGDTAAFMLQKINGMSELFLPRRWYRTGKPIKQLKQSLQKIAAVKVFQSQTVNGLQLRCSVSQASLDKSMLANADKPSVKIYFSLRNASDKKIEIIKLAKLTLKLKLKMFAGKDKKAIKVSPAILSPNIAFSSSNKTLQPGNFVMISTRIYTVTKGQTHAFSKPETITFKPGKNSKIRLEANLVISEGKKALYDFSAEGSLKINSGKNKKAVKK